jgi:hypothetical protein
MRMALGQPPHHLRQRRRRRGAEDAEGDDGLAAEVPAEHRHLRLLLRGEDVPGPGQQGAPGFGEDETATSAQEQIGIDDPDAGR